ncbi:MAG: glycerophosphodiester phosphodiesterase [Candidatus Xenobia bacterium]
MLPLVSPARLYVVGHRGDASLAPENTMASFRAAYDHGVDMIELDARRTRDGVLVLSHDPTVDRCTNGHGLIRAMTFAQVESLDAGSKFGKAFAGEKIPTLDQALDWAQGRIKVDIHINNDDHEYPGLEQDVVRCVRTHHAEQNVLISSMDRPMIAALKQQNPDLTIGMLTQPFHTIEVVKRGLALGAGLGLLAGLAISPLAAVVTTLAGAAAGFAAGKKIGNAQSMRGVLESGVDVVLPFWANVESGFVRQAHAMGKAVIPYAENAPLLVDAMRAEGCDGIISDVPEKFSRR